MTSKVQSSADYWTDDVKITSKVQPAVQLFEPLTEKTWERDCVIFWWSGKQRAKWRNSFKNGGIFWMNNKAVIEIGFRKIRGFTVCKSICHTGGGGGGGGGSGLGWGFWHFQKKKLLKSPPPGEKESSKLAETTHGNLTVAYISRVGILVGHYAFDLSISYSRRGVNHLFLLILTILFRPGVGILIFFFRKCQNLHPMPDPPPPPPPGLDTDRCITVFRGAYHLSQ